MGQPTGSATRRSARPDLGADDLDRDGATSVRARRGPLQESPVNAARSHGGLEIDAASSAAVARPGFANTPDDAVDNLRFYDRQQAYVSARPRSAHKTRIDTFAKRKKVWDATRSHTAQLFTAEQHEGFLQHTRPAPGALIASLRSAI